MKTLSALNLLPALTTTALFLASMISGTYTWVPVNIRPRWFKLNRANSPEPASEIRPESPEPLTYHSLMVNAARHYAFKNYTLALVNYRRVLADQPNDVAALSGEAWSLYYMGQEAQAAKDFQTLLKFDANDSWAREGMALCSHKLSA